MSQEMCRKISNGDTLHRVSLNKKEYACYNVKVCMNMNVKFSFAIHWR